MNIKDRIKFFQTLKANQEPKPLPKPLPNKTIATKTQHPKTTTDQAIKPPPPKTESKPIVSLSQNHLQQPQKNETLKAPQVIGIQKHPIIAQQQPPKSTEVIAQQITPNIVPTDLQKNQAPKSSETIIQQKVPITVLQQQNKQSNLSTNPEKPPEKEGSTIMSVKQRLKLLEQRKFTIVQQPPVMKSCFVASEKKPPAQQKSQTTNHNTGVHPNQIRISAPEKSNTDESEKRLTFQEKRLLAEGLLSKPRAPTKVYEPQQNQANQSQQKPMNSQQNQELNSHQIKVQLEPEIQKIQEDPQQQNKEKKEKADTESDILFKEALKKQSEPTLFTGQSTNLTLGVRKTMAKKRNNDEFDDL